MPIILASMLLVDNKMVLHKGKENIWKPINMSKFNFPWANDKFNEQLHEEI